MTARRKRNAPQRERAETRRDTAAATPRRTPSNAVRVLVGVAVAGALVVAARFALPRLNPTEVPVPPKGVIDDPEIAAAVDAAVAAVRAAPDDADRWADLAMTYDANVIPSTAAACYRRAVELRPGVAEWWYDLAAVLERDDQSDEAAAAVRRAAELAPEYAPLHVSAALWALTRGHVEAAEIEAQRAVAASGGSADALIALGRVQLEHGRDDDAAQTLARAVGKWPRAWGDAAYPRFLLGTALARLGRADEAAPMLANGVVAPPQLPDPWRDDVARGRQGLAAGLAKAQRLMEAGRLDQALALSEELHRRRPDSVAAATNLGFVYMSASRYEDAAAVLGAAAAAHPESADTAARLAGAVWMSGRHEEALRAADAAVARFPLTIETLTARGELLLNAELTERALADFEAVARLAPADAAARASAGVALLRLGRDRPAQAAFEEALRRRADDPTAIAGLALVAVHRGDVPDADRWLARIAGVAPQGVRLVAEARQARADAR